MELCQVKSSRWIQSFVFYHNSYFLLKVILGSTLSKPLWLWNCYPEFRKKRILQDGDSANHFFYLVNMDWISVWRTYPIVCKVRRKHCDNLLQLSVYREVIIISGLNSCVNYSNFLRKASCLNLDITSTDTFQVILDVLLSLFICLHVLNLILSVNMLSFNFR